MVMLNVKTSKDCKSKFQPGLEMFHKYYQNKLVNIVG